MACPLDGGAHDYKPTKMDDRMYMICGKCGHIGKEVEPSYSDLKAERDALKFTVDKQAKVIESKKEIIRVLNKKLKELLARDGNYR